MRSFDRRYAALRGLIDGRLASLVPRSKPRDLMDGSRYVLRTEGKRIRPVMVMLSCEAAGGRARDALDAAVALEMLHNFTLVHDDVMDDAPSRRGHATVHTRWGVNTAILVGDVILGMAYRTLLRSHARNLPEAMELFTEGLVEVCRGQGLDVAYERDSTITMRDYYRMIDSKTGKLFSTAARLGGVLGHASPRHSRSLGIFGQCIGRAFQVQDDLLDVIADEGHLGKRIGGDIVSGKKTFLLVEALRRARGRDRRHLRLLMSRRRGRLSAGGERRRVDLVTALYARCGVMDAARERIRIETGAGLRALETLPRSGAREMLRWMAGMLVQRSY